jgi:hypothetical protein
MSATILAKKLTVRFHRSDILVRNFVHLVNCPAHQLEN